MSMENPKPNVAVLASPGMGLLIPVLELAKRLVTLHGVDVTIFIVTTNTSTAQNKLLQSLTVPNGLQIVDLPPPNISGLVSDSTAIATRISIIVRESLPALRSAIAEMESRPSALIVDMFGTDAFDIARQLELPTYVLITSTALFLALVVYAPSLDREVDGEFVDLQEPVQIPGCRPIRIDDLVDPLLDRKNEQYNVFLRMGSRFPKANGILLNTWEDLEPNTLRALREETILRQIITQPIYPIGPLVRAVGQEAENPRNECLNWLHTQDTESVLYVSFGSGGTLSPEQVTELAWGLELSQQRFLWVVRPPTKKDVSGTFFSAGSGRDDPSEYLPDGFLSRTHKVGFVESLWAPQEHILGHPSIGGFLSHSGWNSTLESIINGVPMIAWPLYAEQKMNATMLTDDLGVAVRSDVLPTKQVITREEIERMVRMVMEGKGGKAMKARIKELKCGASRALDKGGSSYNALSQVTKEWEVFNASK